ncbi:MAG: long-chain fatty acid--CoA ligase [Desulfobacteraceae bacterium]|uniref:Long-chain fatty acid--CoA ligase n=1 Tax=Candidatus Desulfacyla euxinica TaxID=2841693 RepID=A0A8J6MXW2_9DELT|nr:long-chain fatty acid--CoA ligase [Candidatus Desulfacyla euxinica]MBL6978122.1 long-chain fatty acid--CoA ligase [Desulfobacteraceae bacterium]MBL7216964.1 long-chain fatty acid--CoA ligase [Desulfobacteraceae bacterium]
MNTSQLLTKSAKTFPENLALVHGPKRLTYAQFNSRVNRLANTLRRLGVKQGDNVAVMQYNYPETLESIFACFKAGCACVPINFRLHPNEVAFIIDHSEAKAVILSPEFNEAFVSIRDRIPNARHLITLANAEDELLDYEKLISAESDQFKDVDAKPDDLAWLFYTSGTTGMPKGVMLTHRNLTAMTMNFYADICPGFGPDDVILHAAPLSHGSGLYSLPNIGKAATNVILASKSFDPELVLKTIQEYRVTNMFVAPTMIKLMVESNAVDRYDHKSLTALNYGGAPILVEDLKQAMVKLGPCLVQVFGQAESPMTLSYLPHRDHMLEGNPEQMKRLASSGLQRTDVELKIFDADDNELPPGETGEIVSRSDLVMKGYWRNPEATEDTIRNGWLHTGDMGYMDEKGYLFIMDRSKDMIISGGENIYPREIEEVLIKHPAVREVAVIGIPDPKWGDAIKAVISLLPGQSATEEELILFCRNNIASYKKPKSVDFVDELPKNNYGKVLKRDLRARYWKDKERKV